MWSVCNYSLLLCVYIIGSTDGSVNIRHEEATLEAAVKELTRARTKMKIHLLRSQQDVKRRLDRANILATTAGSPGMAYFLALRAELSRCGLIRIGIWRKVYI